MKFTSALTTITVGVTVAALSGCGGAAAEQAPSERPAPADRPTVVLVHGAFADSSSWNGVIEDLKRDGYPVIAAANPLRGSAQRRRVRRAASGGQRVRARSCWQATPTADR